MVMAKFPPGGTRPFPKPPTKPLPTKLGDEGGPKPSELKEEGGPVPTLRIKEGGPLPTKHIEGGPVPTLRIKEGGPVPTKALIEGGPVPTRHIGEGGPKPQPPSKIIVESGIKLPPDGAPPVQTMALFVDPKTGEQRNV